MTTYQDSILNHIGTISSLAIAALMTVATVVSLIP